MTDIAAQRQHQDETTAPADEDGVGFLNLTGALHDESQRLIRLAEGLLANAQQLAEREARATEREQAIEKADHDLQARRAELNQRKRELEELAARADEAHARVAEAAEREDALKAIAQSLLDRYGQDQPTGHD